MKFELTNPKAWNAVNEKDIPMKHKIKVYEKLGGAYRLGEDGGEQVFNKMTELLKHKIQEDTTYKKSKKSVSYQTMKPEMKVSTDTVDFDVEEPVVKEDDASSPEETLAGLNEMAMGNLERIADYSNMILQRMNEGQELSSWMYSQLTIALENLNSVHDAMDGDDGNGKYVFSINYGNNRIRWDRSLEILRKESIK
jgi:hypothetical protein